MPGLTCVEPGTRMQGRRKWPERGRSEWPPRVPSMRSSRWKYHRHFVPVASGAPNHHLHAEWATRCRVEDRVPGRSIRDPGSAQVSAGDSVGVREKARKQLRIQSALEIASQVGLPEWVDVDAKKMAGVLKSLPERQDILPDINENLVVELYSK